MVRERKVSRDLIVQAMTEALEPLSYVHAFWEAGAAAFNRIDEWSDIDLYIVVDDDTVLTVSAPDKFLVREIHGEVVFLFNKGDSIKIPPLDREAFVRGLHDHRRRLRERMELFGPFVEKEILRGDRLEALEFYRALVVPSLVGALRMRYGPRHYDFRMRYVYRELPPDVVRRLEGLAFVRDPDDLATKYRQARVWFDKAIEDVDEEQVRRDVAGTSK